jgi:hypothetical protein
MKDKALYIVLAFVMAAIWWIGAYTIGFWIWRGIAK